MSFPFFFIDLENNPLSERNGKIIQCRRLFSFRKARISMLRTLFTYVFGYKTYWHMFAFDSG